MGCSKAGMKIGGEIKAFAENDDVTWGNRFKLRRE
jgi:hypothetical protein